MIHLFPRSVETFPLPEKFTFPFHYEPHPLCISAANEVQAYLKEQKAWTDELQQGKMFGVLVVQTPENTLGYLAAFSGNLDGKSRHPWFVPPICDFTDPDGFFKVEERNISALNSRIERLENDPKFLQLKTQLQEAIDEAGNKLADAKKELKAGKEARDKRRKEGLDEWKNHQLIRESQFAKAEYKRLERFWQEKITLLKQEVGLFVQEIESLCSERKTRSAALQQQLFDCFVLMNAYGERRALRTVFEDATGKIPPAGAGECAAPKLLQFAYIHSLKPIAMAEFWWGDSPKTEIRRHGNYYPACSGKCGPILNFMLQGLTVEENPLTCDKHRHSSPEVVYEDAWMVAVNKPAGMLSVPGKQAVYSVYDWMKSSYPDADGPLIVHRLDMATSGLLLLAKSKTIHKQLQAMFKNRKMEKRYIAIVDGDLVCTQGTIELPLCLDPDDRPRQTVNYQHGKPAITRYEVIQHETHGTRVAFYPQTGRTHQLRVHAAHPSGLNAPIVGDSLYGKGGGRLYLHAESLSFRHPVTGQELCLQAKAPF